MNKIENREMISALADGQLQGQAFAMGMEAMGSDPGAQEIWRTYHLIGDVLRTGELAAGTPSELFVNRFQQRMALEPAYKAMTGIGDFVATNASAGRSQSRTDASRPAANDGSFRWKLVAGFASLAAVGVLGWTAVSGFGGLTGQPEQARLAGAASQSGEILAGNERGVMIRDAQLDELLAAHRQFGGASALQKPAGFLRNATFEGPAR